MLAGEQVGPPDVHFHLRVIDLIHEPIPRHIREVPRERGSETAPLPRAGGGWVEHQLGGAPGYPSPASPNVCMYVCAWGGVLLASQALASPRRGRHGAGALAIGEAPPVPHPLHFAQLSLPPSPAPGLPVPALVLVCHISRHLPVAAERVGQGDPEPPHQPQLLLHVRHLGAGGGRWDQRPWTSSSGLAGGREPLYPTPGGPHQSFQGGGLGPRCDGGKFSETCLQSLCIPQFPSALGTAPRGCKRIIES